MFIKVENKKIQQLGIIVVAFAMAALFSFVFGGSAQAATFEVTNTNDTGAGSLQQAIADANATIDHDTITFNIPGAGPHTIAPSDEFSIAGGPVTIDGCSQPGSDCSQFPLALQIELNGANMPVSSSRGVLSFGLDTDNTVVRGLSITGGSPASRAGIRFIRTAVVDGFHTPSAFTIQSNFIGVAPDGTTDANSGGLSLGSVAHDSDHISDDNMIGGSAPGQGNVISGNTNSGISANGNPFDVRPMENLTIQNNYIGLDPTGTQARPNGGSGINVSILSNALFDGNHIAHNGQHGISFGNRSDDSVISNNQIHDNGANGINLAAVTSPVGPLSIVDNTVTSQVGNGLFMTNSNNVRVGGTASGQANTFNGNGASGAQIAGTTSNNVHITGNQANENAQHGVLVGTATDIQVMGNHTMTNGENGINLDGTTSSTVQGNTANVNTIGIFAGNSSDITVGGVAAGEGNTAHNNTSAGIAVGLDDTDTSTGVTIRGNHLQNNDGLGIDLANDGVTPNAPAGDVRTGPNTLLNYPMITSFTHGSAIIEGIYEGPANATFTLDFYMNETADPSGHGEGQTWISSGDVTTDGDGNATFTFTFDVTVPDGWQVSSTATDADGNTSEFSGVLEVPPAPVTQTPPADTSDGNDDSLAATGQNTLLYAVIGSLLVVSSLGLLFRHKIVNKG